MDTTTITPTAPATIDRRTLLLYYAYGLAVVAAMVFITMRWGAQYPYLHLLDAAVCTYVGKLLGLPLDVIYAYAIQKQPEKAMAVAVQALRSLPPERIEAATRELISSIPPAAQQAVLLINTTEPPPSNAPPDV